MLVPSFAFRADRTLTPSGPQSSQAERGALKTTIAEGFRRASSVLLAFTPDNNPDNNAARRPETFVDIAA
jgi:hypothetical protein